MIETQIELIHLTLPNHTIIYVGNEYGFNISGIPLGGEAYITAKLQKNLDKTKQVIANILKPYSFPTYTTVWFGRAR